MSRRRWLPLLAAAIVASGTAGLPVVAAGQAASTTGTAQSARGAAEPAELKIANRSVFTMRASVFGSVPAERAEASADRIRELTRKGGPLQVTTRAMP